MRQVLLRKKTKTEINSKSVLLPFHVINIYVSLVRHITQTTLPYITSFKATKFSKFQQIFMITECGYTHVL